MIKIKIGKMRKVLESILAGAVLTAVGMVGCVEDQSRQQSRIRESTSIVIPTPSQNKQLDEVKDYLQERYPGFDVNELVSQLRRDLPNSFNSGNIFGYVKDLPLEKPVQYDDGIRSKVERFNDGPRPGLGMYFEIKPISDNENKLLGFFIVPTSHMEEWIGENVQPLVGDHRLYHREDAPGFIGGQWNFTKDVLHLATGYDENDFKSGVEYTYRVNGFRDDHLWGIARDTFLIPDRNIPNFINGLVEAQKSNPILYERLRVDMDGDGIYGDIIYSGDSLRIPSRLVMGNDGVVFGYEAELDINLINSTMVKARYGDQDKANS